MLNIRRFFGSKTKSAPPDAANMLKQLHTLSEDTDYLTTLQNLLFLSKLGRLTDEVTYMDVGQRDQYIHLTFDDAFLATTQLNKYLQILPENEPCITHASAAKSFLRRLDYSEPVKARALQQANTLGTIAAAMNWSQDIWPQLHRNQHIQQLDYVARTNAYIFAHDFKLAAMMQDKQIIAYTGTEKLAPIADASYHHNDDQIRFNKPKDSTRDMLRAVGHLAHEQTHQLNRHTINANYATETDIHIKTSGEKLNQRFKELWPRGHRHYNYAFGVYYAQPEERIARTADRTARDKLQNVTKEDYASLADQLTDAPKTFDLIVHNARIMANDNPANFNELADPLAPKVEPPRRRHQSHYR